jgi:hypothetical protein
VSQVLEVSTTANASLPGISVAAPDPLPQTISLKSVPIFEEVAGSAGATPAPRFAGLVSAFLPVDRGTLERAVDRFLDGFDRVAVELTGFEPPPLMISTGTIGLTILTLVAIARRERSDERGKRGHNRLCRVEMALLRTLPIS